MLYVYIYIYTEREIYIYIYTYPYELVFTSDLETNEIEPRSYSPTHVYGRRPTKTTRK